jgi:hypothetical protein
MGIRAWSRCAKGEIESWLEGRAETMSDEVLVVVEAVVEAWA